MKTANRNTLAIASLVGAMTVNWAFAVNSPPSAPDCDNPDNVVCLDEINKCYCYDPSFVPSTFGAAVEGCKSVGFDPVSIHSDLENNFLANALRDRVPPGEGAWLGLVRREEGNQLFWLTGEAGGPRVYTSPNIQIFANTQRDCNLFFPERVQPSASHTLVPGFWVEFGCDEGARTIICQLDEPPEEAQDSLQHTLFEQIPDGVVTLFDKISGGHLSQDGSRTEMTSGTAPDNRDRFRFVSHPSGNGVLLQGAVGLDAEGNPLFSDEEGFIGAEYFANQPFQSRIPISSVVLVDRASAAIFTLAPHPDGPTVGGVGLRLRFDPTFHLTADEKGRVSFRNKDSYIFDIRAAPRDYKMVLTIDDFDFEKVITSNGGIQNTIAVERTISSTSESAAGTYSVTLSSEQEESRTLVTSAESAKQRFFASRQSQSQSSEVSSTASAGFEFLDGLFGASASLTTSASSTFSTSLENSRGFTRSESVADDVSESRTIQFQDTFSLNLEHGKTVRARLLLVRRVASNVEVMATAHVYANGVLILVDRFPVVLEAVSLSSGTVVVDEILPDTDVSNGNNRRLRRSPTSQDHDKQVTRRILERPATAHYL